MSINQALILKERIQQLEKKQQEDLLQLKQGFNNALDSVKPSNLLKNAFASTVESAGVHDTLLQSIAGMLAGYITKKVVAKNPGSLLGKGVGFIIQVILSGLAAKNADSIKKMAGDVLDYGFNLINKNQTDDEPEATEEKPA